MKKIKILISLLVTFLFVASALCAEEKKEGVVEDILKVPLTVIEKTTDATVGKLVTKPEKEATKEGKEEGQPKVRKTRKDMTNEELVKYIEATLDEEDEIANLIPGLKKVQDDKGNVSYLFEGTKIGDLSREKLETLYARVQNEAVRIRTERMNRQLESIRQAENAARAAQATSRVPVIVSPPQPPQTSQTPPSPPAATPPPPPPPQPQRR